MKQNNPFLGSDCKTQSIAVQGCPGYPQTQNNPPASASRVLELQA